LPATRELYADGRGRRGLDSYLKYGYIPLEDPVREGSPVHPGEQVSRTLEYAYDDSVVARLPRRLAIARMPSYSESTRRTIET